MNTKLITALACGAALALGACSGGSPAAPTPPTAQDPGTADPGADGRTAAERAFDNALDEAKRDLAAARTLVTAAEDAANAAADTDAARAAAQMEIDRARKALADAVAAARALDAPSGDFERIGAAAIQVDKAEAAEDEDEAKLRAAEGSTGWAGSSALVIRKEILRPAPALTAVVRRPRQTDGADAETLLTAAKIPAVMHEDGKIVMGDGLSSSGDRLRMRGIPVIRGGGTGQALDNRQFLSFEHFFVQPFQRLDPVGGGNDGPEPKLVAGLRITLNGLVVDMGGKYAPGVDFRTSDVGTSGRIWSSGTSGNDLTLNFGRPAASPEGNAEHYWTAALMPSPELLEANSALFREGGVIVPVGTYTMRLSNHAGLDRNLEDPDAPPYTVDDVNHYLSYAAYGHMEFLAGAEVTHVTQGRRSFPFHVGYDAFKDEADMRTTDIADADKITRGKFKGRTLASQLPVVFTGGAHLGLTDANYLRLRGDVELTATISGTATDNKISGKIMNLESWDGNGFFWKDYAAITGDLALQESDIGASGSFAGVVDTASLSAFTEGGYEGNFYGPPASLEAAGIWYLQDGDPANSAARNLSIVGSFGAALVRDDGVWGMARRGGG